MSSTLIALFFAAIGFYSLRSLMSDLGSGNARSRNSSFNVRESPGAFYLIVFCKAAFVSFAIAIVLNAFGLIGDPFVWMHRNLPFLMPPQCTATIRRARQSRLNGARRRATSPRSALRENKFAFCQKHNVGIGRAETSLR
jgi:hypothetical protein